MKWISTPSIVRYELWEGIELRFRLAPVVARSPIAHQFLEFCELYALRLVIDRLSVGPPRCSKTTTEVDERLFRHLDAEGSYLTPPRVSPFAYRLDGLLTEYSSGQPSETSLFAKGTTRNRQQFEIAFCASLSIH